MRFPERHPILGLFSRLGWACLLCGLALVALGALFVHLRPTTSPPPWAQWFLAWSTSYLWIFGLFMAVLGCGLLIYRATIKRAVLFGGRINRDYPPRRQ